FSPSTRPTQIPTLSLHDAFRSLGLARLRADVDRGGLAGRGTEAEGRLRLLAARQQGVEDPVLGSLLRLGAHLLLGLLAVQLDRGDRKSTRLNSSHVKISYAVFC